MRSKPSGAAMTSASRNTRVAFVATAAPAAHALVLPVQPDWTSGARTTRTPRADAIAAGSVVAVVVDDDELVVESELGHDRRQQGRQRCRLVASGHDDGARTPLVRCRTGRRDAPQQPHPCEQPDDHEHPVSFAARSDLTGQSSSVPSCRGRRQSRRRPTSTRSRQASCGCSFPFRCRGSGTSIATRSRTNAASRWSTRACPARNRGRRWKIGSRVPGSSCATSTPSWSRTRTSITSARRAGSARRPARAW